MERSRGRSKPARSSFIIERIDQALAELVEIRSNTGLYWRRFCDSDSEVGKALLSEAVVDLAAELYSRDARAAVELVEFTDGAFDVLFDLVAERTVLVHGLSRYTSPNSRDVSYHRGFPSVAGYDKGHAMSHAQGGLEGGPNYFAQVPWVNRRLSPVGKALARYRGLPGPQRGCVLLRSFDLLARGSVADSCGGGVWAHGRGTASRSRLS